MSEKRYYWLKLQSDFFNSKRIKKLRKLAGGDTYTIIYLKMQLLAMQHDGILKWSGLEEDFASELALDLDESPENVEVTLRYLLSCGLAETDDNVSFFLPWAVANTGSETGAAERMRKMRERNKAVTIQNPVTPMLRGSYTEIETEIEKRDRDRYSAVVEAWNALGLNEVRKITGERERLLKARIKEYGEDGVLEAIGKIKDSKFLMGGGDKGWTITFDWFLGPRNFAKVLEGNYSDKGAKVTASCKDERPADMDYLRKALEMI